MAFNKKQNALGLFLLFFCAIVWGSSFLILKNTIEVAPPIFVVGIRFLSASILLGIFLIKKLKNTPKHAWLDGFILGLSVFVAYLTQTYGLAHTSPARNAFVTALYCVICPFLIWAFRKIKPRTSHVVSAFICIIGIGLISFSNGLNGTDKSLLIGDGLTLIAAIAFAFQILFIDKYKERNDITVLTFIQLLTTGALLLIFSACFEIKEYGIDSFILSKDGLINVLYLTVFATLLTQLFQAEGLKRTTANQGALILCLESVFGVLFSVLFGNEKITLTLGIGFAVIFIAVVISQLNFKPRIKNDKLKTNEETPKLNDSKNLE